MAPTRVVGSSRVWPRWSNMAVPCRSEVSGSQALRCTAQRATNVLRSEVIAFASMGWRERLPAAASFASKHPRLARLVDNVLEGAGRTDPALRQAAALAGNTPPEWAGYLKKLALHAYRITDEDLAALKK